MEQVRVQVGIMGPRRRMYYGVQETNGDIVYRVECRVGGEERVVEAARNQLPEEPDPARPIWSRVQAILTRYLVKCAMGSLDRTKS